MGRFDSSTRNSRCNAPLSASDPAASMVVGLVCVELLGTFSRTSPRSQDRGHLVQQGLEGDRIVDIRRRQLGRERDPIPIYNEVVFAARFSAVGRIWTRLWSPFFAGTLALSREARLQSIWSARPSSSRSTRWSRCQTPDSCQSLNRRQQVIPLPQPSSCGRYSHGIPVFSTNRMPVRAARFGTRGRPPFGLAGSAGRRGSIRFQSASDTNGLPTDPTVITTELPANPFC